MLTNMLSLSLWKWVSQSHRLRQKSRSQQDTADFMLKMLKNTLNKKESKLKPNILMLSMNH